MQSLDSLYKQDLGISGNVELQNWLLVMFTKFSGVSV